MSQLIATKPLSQLPAEVKLRQMVLDGNQTIEKYRASARRLKRSKLDAKYRSKNERRYHPRQTVARWNEAVRHHTRGRDTGYTSIAMEIPEWIVAEFFAEIEAWKANHTPPRQHLEAVNARIMARKRGAK